ncbi:unnamed protein product, partial [Rotaria sordida]
MVPADLKLSIRLIDTEHSLNGSVVLCPLDVNRKIYTLVGCSQPLYNVDKLEAKWPGLIRMWVLFYVNYLGFGKVHIYDIDGSTKPYIGGLVERGALKYYNSWAPTESMLNLSLNGSRYCSETMMENQCLWQNRGLSEWVMLIHAPDNFLNDFARAPTLINYLNTIKHTIALSLLTTFAFGHPNVTISKQQPANTLFETVTIRECGPFLYGRHLPIANPRQVMMLFVHVALEPFDKILTVLNECPVR